MTFKGYDLMYLYSRKETVVVVDMFDVRIMFSHCFAFIQLDICSVQMAALNIK